MPGVIVKVGVVVGYGVNVTVGSGVDMEVGELVTVEVGICVDFTEKALQDDNAKTTIDSTIALRAVFILFLTFL